MARKRMILVAVDGSAPALRAVDESIRDARLSGAQVHVLAVQPPPDDYGMVPAYLSPAKQRALQKSRTEEILAPALARLRTARVRHAGHVARGEPAARIVGAARRLQCASIVMGTRGMTAAANMILGGVATRVVHKAKVPVTLVR